VFDLGKPLNQKCPKCGTTFDVMPDGAVEAAPNEAPAAPVAEAAVKDVSPKAPTSPAPASAAPAAEPVPVAAESGISFLNVLAIFALLFIIIIVQVVTIKKTENRLSAVKEQLNTLSSQVQSLTKKLAQP